MCSSVFSKRNLRIVKQTIAFKADRPKFLSNRKSRVQLGMNDMQGLLRLKFFVQVFTFFLTVISGFVAANAADTRKPVFVKASCSEAISSTAISSFEEEIRKSQKYRLVRDMSDEGQMDIVFIIDINCTERNGVAAIATVFGRAKCFSTTNCHVASDGSSVRAQLCNAEAAAECGRSLFKVFDDYVIDPIKPQLRVN